MLTNYGKSMYQADICSIQMNTLQDIFLQIEGRLKPF